MKKKTRRFKIRYIIFGLLGAMVLTALVFMRFGGFGTGENVNPEEFLAYAEPVENISVPKSAKIIALGEATHGNAKFQQLKLEVFKQVVEHNGVRAFALEGDYGGCEQVNRYIHGGEGTAQEAAAAIGFAIYRTEEMAELISYMRQYNESASKGEDLHFYGFDMQRIAYSMKFLTELEDLLNILSSAIGSLTNPEKLKNTFKTVKKSKITSKTIKKYLDCFEDSFLIESAQRYDIKGKTYIETPKKYYFSDLGLRNARINFRQFEQTHSMENVIYNELRMRGYSVDVGVVTIAEKDQEGKVTRKQLEVDFVCNLGSSRYYIQSAYSLPDEAKRTQEIRPFRKIDDSFKKIVITKDIVQPYYDNYGILTVNIYDFLLDPQILEK